MAWLLVPQLVALAIFGVAMLAGGGGLLRRPAVYLTCAGLAAAALGVGAVGERLWSDRDHNRRLSATARLSKGGADIGVRTRFVEAAREAIPAGDSFHMVFRGRRREAAYQWTAYRLFPRRATAAPSDATWLVFYGVSPANAGYPRRSLEIRTRLSDRFVVARRQE